MGDYQGRFGEKIDGEWGWLLDHTSLGAIHHIPRHWLLELTVIYNELNDVVFVDWNSLLVRIQEHDRKPLIDMIDKDKKENININSNVT